MFVTCSVTGFVTQKPRNNSPPIFHLSHRLVASRLNAVLASPRSTYFLGLPQRFLTQAAGVNASISEQVSLSIRARSSGRMPCTSTGHEGVSPALRFSCPSDISPGRTHARTSAVPCVAGPRASRSGVAATSAPVSGPFASACGPTACPYLCRNTGIEKGTPAWGDSSTPCGDPGVFVGRSS
jgi:hypothetical protein